MDRIQINLRLSPEQRHLYGKAAALKARPLATWIKLVLDDEASRLVGDDIQRRADAALAGKSNEVRAAVQHDRELRRFHPDFKSGVLK